MTKLKIMLMAAIIAIGQIFALPASAEHTGWTDNKGVNVLINVTLSCGINVLISGDTFGKETSCAIGAAGALIASAITDALYHAVPDSRWSFDGGDGMPKAVYSFSDAAKLSFGAKGAPLDYDGIAVGLKYSF